MNNSTIASQSSTTSVLKLPSAKDSSSISLISATLWFWSWMFFKMVNWIVLYAPSVIIRILSTDFQITLSLYSILMGLGIMCSICFLIVRYKYLTGYSKSTKPNNERFKKSKMIDIVDSMNKKKSSGDKSSNYLDEFLSAIKVFGYLERPVFHELTKNMTTQNIESDELVFLDENLGFSIVVDGVIQVFTKMNEGNFSSDTYSEDGDLDNKEPEILVIGDQKYQLLNEVKSGSPLSSLLSTLDLFKSFYFESSSPLTSNYNFEDVLDDKKDVDETKISPFDNLLKESEPNSPSPVTESLEREHPTIIARPKPTDKSRSATLAIIPHSAFQRVQSKYPKATSHIVTMVLTRLYKVTFNTIHNYLGLTREIVESEIKLNNFEGKEAHLPRYLYDGVLQKFYGKDAPQSFGDKSSSRVLSSSRKTSHNARKVDKSSSRYVVLDSRLKSTHPGDLLSSVPLSRRSEQSNSFIDSSLAKRTTASTSSVSTPNNSASLPQAKRRHSMHKVNDLRETTFSDEREETEDSSLRTAIIENIFKLLGINENVSLLNGIGELGSGQSSVGSSVIGLSGLMSLDNDGKFNQGVYDPMTGRMRYNSFNSMSSSFSRGTAYGFKFYNTINQSELKGDKSLDSSVFPNVGNSSRRNRASMNKSPSQFETNFSAVKDGFSKVLNIKYVAPDTVLASQGTFNSGIYYVIDGNLDVVYRDTENKSVKHKLYTVNPGGLAGYLTSVVGSKSLASIKTPSDKSAIVAHISKYDFSKLMDKFYFLQLPLALKLKKLLSKKVILVDYALEWCHIPAGNVLCSQGDPASGFHIVLSGRFRAIRYKKPGESELNLLNSVKDIHDYNNNLIDESSNRKHLRKGNKSDDFEVLGEHGHGESIGEVEVLTAAKRSNSLIAVRDSETARIPRSLFEILSLQNPSIMVKVSRMVASKVLKKQNNDAVSNFSGQTTISSSTSPYLSTDYKTITIMPTTSGLPVRDFAEKLVTALKTIGRNVIALDQASILTHLGRHAFDERLAQLKLSGYFAYMEEEYETIVYICDTPLKSNWTSTCISQGDCILLLADASDYEVAANVGEYERLLIKLKTTARTDLCLIHPERYVEPGTTSIWLKNRIWVNGHHHIQMEIAKSTHGSNAKKQSNLISDLAMKLSNKTSPQFRSRLENVKSKAISSIVKLNNRFNRHEQLRYRSIQSYKNDFLRLARILSNEAVGLVLGGGGSRGISHVGVVMALERHGIPVDLIGGTSIGSFVGGLYAKDYDSVSIYGRAKKFSKRISSLWRSLFDLTYPVTSYITGYEFNRGIWKIFGFSEIEDFWIKFFCNSTNITNSTMDIHETGYSWRFIRASMSLAGLLPPIAYDGCMLLDGGYLDNLPVMEMKKKGAKYIIAVDVGSADDRTPMNYGDTLSGFWVLFNRWNPFSKHPNVPNMMDIQMRLAYVASVNALELAKKTPGVIYFRPPIDNYATLDFAKFEEIYHVGFAYADNLLTEFKFNGKLPNIAGLVDKSKMLNGEERKSLYRRSSI